MRTLTGSGVPNIQAPTEEYPYGRYKDKSSAGTNDGTELSERVLGDYYQGMLNTITRTGATPNNQPESTTKSQIADAIELLKPVATCVIGSDDGTTFGVLSSIIRDPQISLAAGFYPYESEDNVMALSANFQIKRNNVLDTTHNYIVTATPAYKFAGATGLTLLFTPMVAVANSPYFNNMNLYSSGVSNVWFLFPAELSPSDAITYSRAVLTIYDAGPVA